MEGVVPVGVLDATTTGGMLSTNWNPPVGLPYRRITA